MPSLSYVAREFLLAGIGCTDYITQVTHCISCGGMTVKLGSQMVVLDRARVNREQRSTYLLEAIPASAAPGLNAASDAAMRDNLDTIRMKNQVRQTTRNLNQSSGAQHLPAQITTKKPLRILVADDHSIVRKGLKQVLLDEFGAVEFGEACNGQEALTHVQKEPWDVALLDVTMPGPSGLDVLKQLKELRPATRVLVLSMHPEDQYAIRVLRAGASGYLTKNTASDLVAEAVRKVLGGGTYVSTSLAESLAGHLNEPLAKAPHEKLSDREFQILRLIAAGKSVKEIGYDLSLSVKTVSTYRTRLLHKLKLSTTAELIRYALREGLIE